MRWLIIGLLVSVVLLLIAAAGVAHHIWCQRSKSGHNPAAGTGQAIEHAEDTDFELEP
jgi:uncharacterized membrane protein